VEDLDTLVRRVDEDRWLATRFAPDPVRKRLIAIYALNYEVARTADTVREVALGDMRLEWWRSALEEIAQSRPTRAHPVLDELAATLSEPKDAVTLQGVVSARAADLEAQPFATWDELERYVDATAGALMNVCVRQSGAARETEETFIQAAGRAWGYTGLLRAAEFTRAKGRSILPRDGGDVAELTARAQRNYYEAKKLAPTLPSDVFPAIGYVALVPGYLRALAKGRTDRAVIIRQVKLIAASATGRL